MGRKPIGKVAMTDAERQRRHRAKLRPKTLKRRVAKLKAELAKLQQEMRRAGNNV